MMPELGTPGGVPAAVPGEANEPPTAVGRPAVDSTPPPNPLLVGLTAAIIVLSDGSLDHFV